MKLRMLAAACGLVIMAAGAAQAETYEVVCDVREDDNMEVFVNGQHQRPNGFAMTTITYRIDDAARTVTRVSRTGTYHKPASEGGGTSALTDQGLQFYDDVRTLTADQIVYCPDRDYRCSTGVTDHGANASTANVSPVIIDLKSGRYSSSYTIVTRQKGGPNRIQIGSTATGTCQRR